MTISLAELGIYAFALFVLVVTPGPVVVATIARTLSTGWRSSMPLAGGVAVCDMIWPLTAIFGLAALVQVYGEIMQVLRYGGALILIWMGWRLITGSKEALETAPDPALMRRTAWQGFAAGFLVNIGNPKAILFFVGILPNLFDIAALTAPDILVIVGISAVVPFLGNVAWALAAQRARVLLTTPKMVRRVNQGSGVTLIGVGGAVGAS
ncbi:MAG: LysE family translocator [Pseudomonadota bacterium]